MRREVAARLFGDQADVGRPGIADRIGADAEDIGVDDADFDDDRDEGSDNLLVLAAAGANGEDDSGDDSSDFRLVTGADGLSIEDPETGQVVLIDPGQLDRLPELADSAAAGDKPSEDLTREVTALVLSLLPGIGEALSARDAYQAFRAAAVALQEGDRATALRMLRRGVFSAAGVVPVFRLGKAALRAARLLFKLGRRAKQERARRESRERNEPDVESRLPSIAPDADNETKTVVRRPWPSEFPEVVVQQPSNSPIRAKAQPEFQPAKAGDYQQAVGFVSKMIDQGKLERIGEVVGERRPIIVPVQAQNPEGRNIIPQAYAKAIEKRFGWSVSTDIVQVNRPKRTGTRGVERFFRRTEFDGPVEPGRDYIIVDDNVTLGGTIADLRAYIENNGGRVIFATTLTSSRPVVRINLRPDALAKLRKIHGWFEPEWKEFFGYDFEGLTNAEADFLLQQEGRHFNAVRNQIIQLETR